MKKSYFLALGAVALIGCGDDDNKNTDMPATQHDMATAGDADVQTASVSGFTIDTDKLLIFLAMHASDPTPPSPQAVVMASCVPNTPVYALYEGGGQSATVQADANCNYTLQAEVGKTIHIVAAANSATAVLPTYSQDAEVVGTSPLTGIPAHVCTSNPYSAPVGVAAGAGLSTDALVADGVCMVGMSPKFTPPYVVVEPATITVAPSGFTIYAGTNFMTSPPTFALQSASNTSPIYGIFKPGLTTDTPLTVQATAVSPSTDTFAPFHCDLKPGFVNFAPNTAQ